MIYRVSGIRLPIGFDGDDFCGAAAKAAGIKPHDIDMLRRVKISLDKRDVNNIFYAATAEIETNAAPNSGACFIKSMADKNPVVLPKPCDGSRKNIVIVGFGPAGMFAALTLARAGYSPVVAERGREVKRRVRDVDLFFKTGVPNPESNVQFGEGGAGTFSDGKLTTGIESPYVRFVFEEFVKHGASPDILWQGKPHIGTDKLRGIVSNIRREVESHGGQVLFGHRLCGFYDGGVVCGTGSGEVVIEADSVILAAGHSASDVYELLRDSGVTLAPKDFSVGVRIEHPRSYLDAALHGRFADKLPAADYKYSVRADDGEGNIRGVYTFCMCPGGSVIGSANEPETVVTNGMSYSRRDEEFSNSAVLVTVKTDDFYDGNPLSGLSYRRAIERRAYALDSRMPACTLTEFLNGEPFHDIFPTYVTASLRAALLSKNFRVLNHETAVLYAAETRSSSPVRVLRDSDTMQAFAPQNLPKIYPCGEGAGYAGGIVSAAVDGISAACAAVR